jgi:hypothetical protein
VALYTLGAQIAAARSLCLEPLPQLVMSPFLSTHIPMLVEAQRLIL